MPGLTLQQRFDRNYVIVTECGCWIWVSRLTTNGYGRFEVDHGRSQPFYRRRAHRASWELHRGPIPPGLCVLHRCDVRCCVNPDHLFLGTPADNSADMVKKGRQARGAKINTNILTEDQVREIRILYQDMSQRAIARKFGVSRWCIQDIISGKNWKYLV